MIEVSKDIAERQVKAALSGDWDALRELYADDVHYSDPDGEVFGAEAAIARLQAQEAPFPDATADIKAIVGDESCAAVEWVFSARNTGALAMPDGTSLPPTERSVTFAVMTLYEVRGGRIVSERNYWDNMSLYGQLGLLPVEA